MRIDNIADTALRAYRVAAGDPSITKDGIFDYVYGVLHAPDYRERFASDLAKGLPRIPLPDRATYRRYSKAGKVLAELHLGYESCSEWPLEVEATIGDGELRPEHFRLSKRGMRFADKEKRTSLIVSDQVRLVGIPPEAHQYQVNGRTPLDWLIYYYKIKTDTRSGIVNDANEWFDDPRDLITTLRRLVHVSVETARIVARLPELLG